MRNSSLTRTGNRQSLSARRQLLLAGLLVAIFMAVAASLVIVSIPAATQATKNDVDQVAASQQQEVPFSAGVEQPRVYLGPKNGGAAEPAPIVVYYYDAQTARWIAVSGAMTPSGPVIEDYTVLPSSAPSSARPRNDVLSVEWLEQNRQSNTNMPRGGGHASQPSLDNTIGFIE